MTDSFKITNLRKAAQMAHAAYYPSHQSVSQLGRTLEAVCRLPLNLGFVARRRDGRLVIAFAGSRNLRDWVGNIRAELRGFGTGRVHAGFLADFTNLVQTPLWSALGQLGEPNSEIVVCGHSRGGALALITAKFLESHGRGPTCVVTFGTPKVGDESFVRSVESPVVRVEAFADMAPRLPPTPFRPCGQLVYLASDGSVRRQRTSAELALEIARYGGVFLFALARREVNAQVLRDATAAHSMDNYVEKLARVLRDDEEHSPLANSASHEGSPDDGW